MKTFFILLMGTFLSITGISQTVTLTFENNNRNRSYEVVIDNTTYRSMDAVASSTTGTAATSQVIEIPTISAGSHNLEVFRLNSSTSSASNNRRSVYSNTFTVRSGYNMNIEIKANGSVSFTEKRIRGGRGNQNNTVTRIPMADADFSEILQSTKTKWTQASRTQFLAETFNNTTYNFSTNQIRTLILQVKAENSRLDLAKLAWMRVTDAANYSSLNDLFASQSSRNDLANYTRITNNTTSNNGSGTTSAQFNQLLQNVSYSTSQSTRFNTIRDAFNNTSNQYSTAQVRQLLQYINGETDRLYLAKLGYARVTDGTSYSSNLSDLFNSQANRDDLYNFTNNTTSTGVKTPMSTTEFNRLISTVNYSSSQSAKFNTIKEVLNNSGSYFSTAQLRQLIQSVSSEGDRLYLAKLSFARVTDPTAFSSLFDLFYTQSNRDELARFTGMTANTSVNTRVPMSDASFDAIYNSASGHFFETSAINALKNAFNNSSNIFSTSQLRQLLGIIKSEPEKLALAKLAQPRAADPSTFITLADVFSSQISRDEFTVFAGGSVASNSQYSSRVPLSDAAFNQLYNSANLHFRQASKVTAVRDAFNTGNYYSLAQIRQLLSIITAEADRLELAKLAYRRASDPTNYSQLGELFSSQASRDDLNVYINANRY